jgi:predicted nucleotidyltransferase
MQAILADKLVDVKNILRKHKVSRAYAFGSVCTETFNAESDIDFIVKFEEGLNPEEYTQHYFSAITALEKLLRRNVELVAEETMQNPYFIKVANLTKTAIYE